MHWSLGFFVTALLGSPCHANPIEFAKQVKGCVQTQMNHFFSNFSGTESCPKSCGGCLTDPMECMATCVNRETACGCSQELPHAASAVDDCCSHVWNVLEPVCVKALHGLTDTVVGQVRNICEDGGDEAGALLQTSKGAFLDGIVDVIVRLQGAEAPHPSTAALFEMAKGAGTKGQAATTYVGQHEMGTACLNMMEGIESEYAKHDEEMPDLHAAAAKISERASVFMGRKLPGLKDKVHRAMTVAWSEQGPGMDFDEVCEVVLKYHEGF